MLTEKDLYMACEKIFTAQNESLNNIEVKINSRLSRTLGRCCYRKSCGIAYPFKIEFSKVFLENATKEDIEGVIKHECSHALCCIKTSETHGHDSYFKEMCKKVGTSNDKTATKIHVKDEEFYKYIVYCEKCGKPVAKYHRAGKVIKNSSLYKSNCCKAALTVKQLY